MIRTVVVCLGDSLTFGARDVPEGYGYPARLEALVSANTGNACLCINKGISRETSTDIARRAFADLRAFPEATLALILAGTNDLKGRPDQDVYVRNMAHIVNAAYATGKRPLVGLLPPVRPAGMWCFPDDVQEGVDAYNSILRGMGLDLVDFADMGDYLVDGVHFGPDGYTEMARRWARRML